MQLIIVKSTITATKLSKLLKNSKLNWELPLVIEKCDLDILHFYFNSL